jgi:hypothetical protein
MKMNLLVLSKNQRLMGQIKRYASSNKADNARAFLFHYFPSKSICLADDKIIMEMADLLSSLSDEPDVMEYLQSLKSSTERLIKFYMRKKSEAVKQNTFVNSHSTHKYTSMTREQRQRYGYTPQMIQEYLKQLDAREAYHCYTEGYEYEHYQVYEWLLHQIKETLSGRKHEISQTVKDPALGV